MILPNIDRQSSLSRFLGEVNAWRNSESCVLASAVSSYVKM